MKESEGMRSFSPPPTTPALMTRKDLSSFTPIIELKDFENICLMGVLGEEGRSLGLGVGMQSGQLKELF